MKLNNLHISAQEKISLIGNLTTLLAAGIPILEAIESLLEDSKGTQKKVLTVLKDDLEAGKHIHSGFEKFPKIFSKVTVNLIKAAEEAGTLETTLKDLKKTAQEEMEFIDKVKSALFYPIIIMAVFFLVTIIIITVVIPKISKVFTKLKVPLPLPTKILIFVSDITLNYTVYLLAILAVLVIIVIILFQFKREFFYKIFSSLPVISQLIRQLDITRFTRSLHLLLISGIPIATALELAEDVIIKDEVKNLVSKARELAISGEQFSHGLKTKKNIFSSVTIKLMGVGEKTGTLANSMQSVSEQMDYEVIRTLNKITILIEPIMLVAVGLSVGALMLAIIAPIYGMISQVGAG